MPIPRHLRHLYRGEAYEAFRRALLDRAGNACEQCGAPNGARVFRTGMKTFAGWWWDELFGIGRDPDGNAWPEYNYWDVARGFGVKHRGVKILIGPSHQNHTPGDLDLNHSRALCQACHLRFDMGLHLRNAHETRGKRKDATRGIIEPEEWGKQFDRLAIVEKAAS